MQTNTRLYGQKGQERAVQRQNNIRVIQLVVSLVLFLMVFIGNGVFPSRMVQVREKLMSVMSMQTDFRGLLSELGTSVSKGLPVRDTLEDFCVEVFGGGTQQGELPQVDVLSAEQRFLSASPTLTMLSEHYRDPAGPNIELSFTLPLAEEVSQEEPVQEEVAQEEPEKAVPAVGTVLLKSDYSGQTPPEKYCMDHISFGELETMTPVQGAVTSVYGYRTHPVNGKYKFHGGLDIAGKTGSPIRAFAAGTVDYIGKNDSYGLYIQLDHGNGIKSFYAHCKSLCVKKGQAVAMGEKVGTVGSTGTATGPHLHLELKYNGRNLDPAYYVETLKSQ